MKQRLFHLRLNCTYQGKDNLLDTLKLEHLSEEGWTELDLSDRTGGFMLFINGLFSCQHLYMRTNSAEHNIVLSSASGDMKVIAGEFWNIRQVDISFKAKLLSGSPTEDDLAYIQERMKHCPVSTNLSDQIIVNNAVLFE